MQEQHIKYKSITKDKEMHKESLTVIMMFEKVLFGQSIAPCYLLKIFHYVWSLQMKV